MIQWIRRLDLKTVVGNAGNARECLSLVDVIERSRFRKLPAEWSYRSMLPRLSLGRTDSEADYRLYNAFTCHFVSEGEAVAVLRVTDRRVPSGHPVGLDFKDPMRTSSVFV